MSRISLLVVLWLSTTAAFSHEPMESLVLEAEMAALEEKTSNYQEHMSDHIVNKALIGRAQHGR